MQRKVCTRKVDELGRIVLPQDARSALKIGEKQSLDIYLDDDSIIIRKNNKKPDCVLCGDSETQFVEIKRSYICTNCISEIKDN